MTRRDYLLIAEAFADARYAMPKPLQAGIQVAADAVARKLKEVNPAFNIEMFMVNAGMRGSP